MSLNRESLPAHLSDLFKFICYRDPQFLHCDGTFPVPPWLDIGKTARRLGLTVSIIDFVRDDHRLGQPRVLSRKSPQGRKERLLLRSAKLMFRQTLSEIIRPVGDHEG